MKLKAQQIPHSSVVGSGVMVTDGEDGPCVAVIHTACQQPLSSETQIALAALVTAAINQAEDL